VLRSSGQRWEPEDMAYDPVVFLNDLDKSGHANSNQLALELWLNLVEEGWMDGYVPASVDRFLHELNQQS